jgi:proteic killer suppression protein
MIKSFRHKGIKKLRRQLAQLNAASEALHMKIPGWDLHPLSGNLKDHWSVSVNGNWRLTFTFENKDAVLVDYQDYH